LVEGTKNVLELLQSDFEVRYLAATESFLSTTKNLPVSLHYEEVKPDLLSQLGSFKTNDGVLAVVQMKDNYRESVEFEDYLFVLDGVSDPGNLGTIIRTLDWFGFAGGVVLGRL
jgi:TrmH family RNA methyltransferase